MEITGGAEAVEAVRDRAVESFAFKVYIMAGVNEWKLGR
jgi:hypothetical protein